MSTAKCPKCNSKNFSSKTYSVNPINQSKTDITNLKPSTDLLAFLILIMVVVPSFIAMLWFFSLGSVYGGLLVTTLGLPAAIFSANTLKANKMLRGEKIVEHTCHYCKSVFDDNGNFLSVSEVEIGEIDNATSPTVAETVEKIKESRDFNEKASPTSEASKVSEAKLCPRCYTESNTFFICKECGYVNKAVGIALFVISLIGLAIGVHGLLAWIAAQNTLWVEIVKTLLCGFPGLLFAYWGIAEVVYLRKSRGWIERHNHDMKELLGFYEKNPNAGFAEAGKFLNRTEQWIELMLNESKSNSR